MNELEIFKSKEFGELRANEINGKAYICLADVCKMLDLEQVSRVKSRLNKDGVIISKVIDKLGREQDATFIDESNLYKVIFQSRKPDAEKFTEWVTNEVLPAIRKTGGYIAGEEKMNEDELVLKAMTVLQTKVEMLKEKNLQLEEKIEQDSSKVLFANCVEASTTSILVRDLAKILKQNGIDIGQNRLFKWLKEHKYLTKDNSPTQKAMELKLFYVNERTIGRPNGDCMIVKTTRVTGKGQVYFINKFKELILD